MSFDNDISNEAPVHPGLENQVSEGRSSPNEEPAVPSLRDRFKAESPRIPGVGELQTKPAGITPKQLAGLAAVVLVAAALLIYWAVARPRAGNAKAAPPAELQLPVETPAPAASLPEASAEQVIASVAEMQKAWTSKEFMYHDALSVLNKPAMLVRLPKGSATQSAGYWAFAMNAAYGDCKLEYVTDMNRLREEYGFRQGTHPMVGDPCSRSVIDPLKLSVMPGNVWVRGGVVQGVDVRPPLEIEVVVRGQKIIANRME